MVGVSHNQAHGPKQSAASRVFWHFGAPICMSTFPGVTFPRMKTCKVFFWKISVWIEKTHQKTLWQRFLPK